MGPQADPSPPEVITLGECMASFVALERGPMTEATRFLRTVAGAEANVAVGLARLGHGVAFVGRVGHDALGTTIWRGLRGEGVDISHLSLDPDAATGVMIRELRDLGPSEVVYWRTGSAGSRLDAADVARAEGLFAGARWLHVTGITPVLSESAAEAVDAALVRAKAHGLTISLDVNIRRRLWSEAQARPALAALASRCRVVLGGLDEVAVIAGLAATLEEGGGTDPEKAAEAVLVMGPSAVVVKLGSAGALERRKTETGTHTTRAPGLAVAHVADPVGAGDAFTAGYIDSWLAGRSAAEALRAANACGAAAVSSVGDQAGLPTAAELDRLMRAGGPTRCVDGRALPSRDAP